jgi:hypothetical protein
MKTCQQCGVSMTLTIPSMFCRECRDEAPETLRARWKTLIKPMRAALRADILRDAA